MLSGIEYGSKAHFRKTLAPYRNCPGKRSRDKPPLSHRGSPDRELTFMRSYVLAAKVSTTKRRANTPGAPQRVHPET